MVDWFAMPVNARKISFQNELYARGCWMRYKLTKSVVRNNRSVERTLCTSIKAMKFKGVSRSLEEIKTVSTSFLISVATSPHIYFHLFYHSKKFYTYTEKKLKARVNLFVISYIPTWYWIAACIKMKFPLTIHISRPVHCKQRVHFSKVPR